MSERSYGWLLGKIKQAIMQAADCLLYFQWRNREGCLLYPCIKVIMDSLSL
ncbi:hypothetical protein [Paenibacillus sambharensis]|uniref:hypothetical protein n=1 Tax=Paenibacillus sambharensis TaxID=1803190 RepID=UPI0015E8B545|nr:hypothetical protein [Paenibacillus sambharensis]